MSKELGYRTYHHNPPHLFLPGATYMITAATYGKRRLFTGDDLLEMIRSALLRQFQQRGWQIGAYVVLANHYHVLARAPEQPPQLARLIKDLHQETGYAMRGCSQHTGRVWWNYWDTCITDERSYFARTNYIHFNPVKHGYVREPKDWKYGSFPDYYETNREEVERVVREYPFDRVSVDDDY